MQLNAWAITNYNRKSNGLHKTLNLIYVELFSKLSIKIYCLIIKLILLFLGKSINKRLNLFYKPSFDQYSINI